MTKELKIGFVGFGEAGYHIAKGLRDAGVKHISAFDINSDAPKLGEKIKNRAAEIEINLVDSNESLARESEVLISVVTADAAIAAAEQNAPFLSKKHFYADLNSVSPDTKRKIAKIISASTAKFVEAAVMSPVPPHGHRVPMFLGGKFADEFAEIFAPYGMNLETISEEIGAAIAVKMCRSIIVKGLEALLLECVLGAVKYGADERVFATLDESFPMKKRWSELASYMVGRVLEHGERRAREMEEVAATLRSIGIEPLMAEAAAKRQEWGGKLNLLEHFGGKDPLDYRAVAQMIEKITTKSYAQTPQHQD